MKPETSKPRINRRYLLIVLLLVVAVYVLVPQIGDFRSSWHLLRRPVPGWTALAIGLTMTTYLSGAATYWLLAFHPLRYGQTVLVQLAAMFINRLLPGGIGAVGANYTYLRRRHHTGAQSAGVVAINNLLGALGHGILVIFTLLAVSGQTALAPSYGHSVSLWLKVAAAAIVVLGGLALAFGRRKFMRQISELGDQLRSYRQRPWRLPAALLSSMALTLGNVFCLSVCALALGVHLPFAIILLVFTFGIGAGTATPTPGGLGGFEAGLAAGFITYHVASPAALAIALLYRLVSYWLPLGFGALAFVICQRQKLFISAEY
jgi:uncharacterized membrane protein YbhN (UPF0104 family)